MTSGGANRPAGLALADLYLPGQSRRLRAEFTRLTPPDRIRALAAATRAVPAETRTWARAEAMVALEEAGGRAEAFLPYRLFTERDPRWLTRWRERVLRRPPGEVADAFLALADAVLAIAASPTLSERHLEALLYPVAQAYPGIRSLARARPVEAA